MNDFQPQPPAGFSNPYEAKIMELERQYSQGIAEGKIFEELKALREQIKVLKAEIGLLRKDMDRISED